VNHFRLAARFPGRRLCSPARCRGRSLPAGGGFLAILVVLATMGCGRLPPPPPAALEHAAAANGAASRPASAPPGTAGPAVAIDGGVGEAAAVAEPTSWTGRLPSGAMALAAEQARPVRLRVAALQLDAPVVPAGVAVDGRLELPGDTHTVAWFVGGAVPGDSGSAVLAAHVDWGGAKGVFFELADLPDGAEIRVDFADGSSLVFRSVGRPEARGKHELPVDELFRRGGEASLTLVTCGGEFDPSVRAYADNTLVSASPA
jgi:hypothetical protein